MKEVKLHPLVLIVLCFIVLCQACGNPTTDSTSAGDFDDMVKIPAGEFVMGARSEQAYQDEYPKHKVSVNGFYMDIHEVTNSDFELFVQATGYKTVAERNVDWEELKQQLPPATPKPADSLLQAGSLIFKATQQAVDLNQYHLWWAWQTGANWKHPEGPESNLDNKAKHPVVHIAREDAQAYATWAGKRLPTEAEWEWAASAGKPSIYPWGNEPIEKAYDKANFWQGLFPFKNTLKDGFYSTAPVQSYAPNGFGLCDMAGNVWEWCSDRYAHNTYSNYKDQGQIRNPHGPTKSINLRNPLEKDAYVIRGGSYLCSDEYCSGYRVARRMSAEANSGTNHIGFRCVKDL